MTKTHIVRSFDEELTNLKSLLLHLGEKCSNQVARVFHALTGGDEELVGEVIWQESEINKLQQGVDELTVALLVKRQPMAVDLRTIVSALKISLEFEQISDHVVTIARYTRDLKSFPNPEPLARIARMAQQAHTMLSNLLEALPVLDVSKARAIIDEDEHIDSLLAGLMEQFPTYMEAESSHIRGSTSVLITARAWERIGDHIKNIAETIVYIATGRAA